MILPIGDPIALGYAIYLLYIAEAIFPQFHYSFTIRNEDEKSAMVKRITIDDIIVIDHEITLGPKRISFEDDDSSFSFNVFQPQVHNFEMILDDDGDDIIYSCELMTGKTKGRIFIVRFGRFKPPISPLESIASPFENQPSSFGY